jgi:hypothetical protein
MSYESSCCRHLLNDTLSYLLLILMSFPFHLSEAAAGKGKYATFFCGSAA